jgi:hypothetical protein
MRFHSSKERQEPLTLVLEPWGEDYTVLPGDEIEIIPGSSVISDIDFESDCIQVWIEGCPGLAHFKVLVNGRKVDCGYGREHTNGKWG